MTLQQIKSALLQTEFGESLRDGMSYSEPIALPTPDGLIDNFFVYLVDKKEHVYSAPVARLGLFAERKQLAYFVSCTERPFSAKPDEIIPAEEDSPNRWSAYETYEELFPVVREILFKENCSDDEKAVLIKFSNAFDEFNNKALLPFYTEMAPTYYKWLREQTSNA